MKKSLILILSVLMLLTLSLSACESEGPAEKAGKKIDEAVEQAQDAAENLEDKVTDEGPMEKAGEKIDEAVEEAKN